MKETLRAGGKYAIKDVSYRMANVREELENAERAVAGVHDIFYGKSHILPADVAERVGEIGAKTLGINDFKKDADELVTMAGTLRDYVDCVEKMLTDAEKLLDVEYDQWKDNSIATTLQYAEALKTSNGKRDEVLKGTTGMIYGINALYRSLWQVEDMLNWKPDERDATWAAKEKIRNSEGTVNDLYCVVRALGTAVEHAVKFFDWRLD